MFKTCYLEPKQQLKPPPGNMESNTLKPDCSVCADLFKLYLFNVLFTDYYLWFILNYMKLPQVKNEKLYFFNISILTDLHCNRLWRYHSLHRRILTKAHPNNKYFIEVLTKALKTSEPEFGKFNLSPIDTLISQVDFPALT